MLGAVMTMQKERRFIIQGIITLILFMGMYFLLDHLNMPYKEMVDEYGIYLVVANIALNILMAFISAAMMNLSSALVRVNGKEGKGTFLSGIAVFFGMLTYGCTPCVVAFFSALGITFSVMVLPLAGLPYKFISFGILILGSLWLLYEIRHAKCKIKDKPTDIQT